METDRLWILVMNATRARILRGLDPDRGVSPELVLRSRQRRLRRVLTDELSAMATPNSNRRSEQDGMWRETLAQDEAAFSEQVAGLLECHRLAGDYSHLVVFGAPQVLELLHQVMPGSLRKRVVAEVASNLISLSEADLQQHVSVEIAKL